MKILDGVIPAKDMQSAAFHKVLLLGHSGCGKTTSLLSWPGRKLLIDTEDRAHPVYGQSDVDVIQIKEPSYDYTSLNKKRIMQPKAWRELNDLRHELYDLAESGKPFPWSVIQVDSVTRMGRLAIHYALTLNKSDNTPMQRGIGGGPQEAHYLPAMNEISSMILSFIPLPCHIVFTGHYRIFEDKQLKTLTYRPMTVGNLREEISTWFSECYEATKIPKGAVTEYQWITGGVGRAADLHSSINNPEGSKWKSPFVINRAEPIWGFGKILELEKAK